MIDIPKLSSQIKVMLDSLYQKGLLNKENAVKEIDIFLETNDLTNANLLINIISKGGDEGVTVMIKEK